MRTAAAAPVLLRNLFQCRLEINVFTFRFSEHNCFKHSVPIILGEKSRFHLWNLQRWFPASYTACLVSGFVTFFACVISLPKHGIGFMKLLF